MTEDNPDREDDHNDVFDGFEAPQTETAIPPSNEVAIPSEIALPLSQEEIWARAPRRGRTLLDLLEEWVTTLTAEHPEFRALLEPVDKAHSVSGSFRDDDTLMANIVITEARAAGETAITSVKFTELKNTMNAALKRRQLRRHQRAAAAAEAETYAAE